MEPILKSSLLLNVFKQSWIYSWGGRLSLDSFVICYDLNSFMIASTRSLDSVLFVLSLCSASFDDAIVKETNSLFFLHAAHFIHFLFLLLLHLYFSWGRSHNFSSLGCCSISLLLLLFILGFSGTKLLKSRYRKLHAFSPGWLFYRSVYAGILSYWQFYHLEASHIWNIFLMAALSCY